MIGGGYATGREIVEYGAKYGALGWLSGLGTFLGFAVITSVSGVVANIQEVTKAANDGAASTGSIAERVTNVDRQAEDMRVLMKQTQEASLMLRKDTKKFTVA